MKSALDIKVLQGVRKILPDTFICIGFLVRLPYRSHGTYGALSEDREVIILINAGAGISNQYCRSLSGTVRLLRET